MHIPPIPTRAKNSPLKILGESLKRQIPILLKGLALTLGLGSIFILVKGALTQESTEDDDSKQPSEPNSLTKTGEIFQNGIHSTGNTIKFFHTQAVEQAFIPTNSESNPCVGSIGIPLHTPTLIDLVFNPDGNRNPISFSATNLPSNVTIDPATGEIYGTPNNASDCGIHYLPITVSNPGGNDTRILPFELRSSLFVTGLRPSITYTPGQPYSLSFDVYTPSTKVAIALDQSDPRAGQISVSTSSIDANQLRVWLTYQPALNYHDNFTFTTHIKDIFEQIFNTSIDAICTYVNPPPGVSSPVRNNQDIIYYAVGFGVGGFCLLAIGAGMTIRGIYKYKSNKKRNTVQAIEMAEEGSNSTRSHNKPRTPTLSTDTRPQSNTPESQNSSSGSSHKTSVDSSSLNHTDGTPPTAPSNPPSYSQFPPNPLELSPTISEQENQLHSLEPTDTLTSAEAIPALILSPEEIPTPPQPHNLKGCPPPPPPRYLPTSITQQENHSPGSQDMPMLIPISIIPSGEHESDPQPKYPNPLPNPDLMPLLPMVMPNGSNPPEPPPRHLQVGHKPRPRLSHRSKAVACAPQSPENTPLPMELPMTIPDGPAPPAVPPRGRRKALLPESYGEATPSIDMTLQENAPPALGSLPMAMADGSNPPEPQPRHLRRRPHRPSHKRIASKELRSEPGLSDELATQENTPPSQLLHLPQPGAVTEANGVTDPLPLPPERNPAAFSSETSLSIGILSEHPAVLFHHPQPGAAIESDEKPIEIIELPLEKPSIVPSRIALPPAPSRRRPPGLPRLANASTTLPVVPNVQTDHIEMNMRLSEAMLQTSALNPLYAPISDPLPLTAPPLATIPSAEETADSQVPH